MWSHIVTGLLLISIMNEVRHRLRSVLNDYSKPYDFDFYRALARKTWKTMKIAYGRIASHNDYPFFCDPYDTYIKGTGR